MKNLIFSLLFILSLSSVTSQVNNVESRGIGGGGSMFSPTISPHSSSEFFVQCDMSEVFHTSDLGEKWDLIHFNELISTGGMNTVEFTSDPNILYSVNLDFNTDVRFPVKSADAGVTWQSINSDPTSGDVWSLHANPNAVNQVLISSYDELFISNDGGNSFQTAYDLGSDFLISGVFWYGDSIFVGTNAGLLVSIDGGTNFSIDNSTGIPAGEGFISFTGSVSGGVVRLMATTAGLGDLYPGVNALDVGIYSSLIKMDYGSNSWTTATTGIDSNDKLFNLSSSLQDINTFYVSGASFATSYPVVYKTTDGGVNWNAIFLTNNNQNIETAWSGYQGDEDWWYGEIVFGIDVAPNDPNTLIITDFGFAHISTDGGDSWKQVYTESSSSNPEGSPTPQNQNYKSNGMENTSSWQLHWTNEDDIFASYTDITGIRSDDGGDTWSFNYSGVSYNTIYHIIEHPTSGVFYAAVSSVHDLYQSTYLTDARIDGGDGAILFSTDQGLTWQMMHDFSMPVVWLSIDPNSTDKMYASVANSSNGGVYKTSDLDNLASSSWTQTTDPPRTEGHAFNVHVLNDGSIVSTFCGRRAPGFTASSGVFHSTDEGVTWQDVSMNDDMYYWTKDITIDPNDATQNTWYVSVFSGWGGAANDKGGVYKTTDRGQNWVEFSDSYRVESVTVNPTNADELYFTTESEGLWFSNNATSSSPIFSQIEVYNFMHPMRVFYNPYITDEVWITSFGNGLRVSVNAPNTDGIAEDEQSKLQIYPNPTHGNFSIIGDDLDISALKMYDLLGKNVVGELSVINSSNSEIRINTTNLKKGIYILKLNGKKEKIVIN